MPNIKSQKDRLRLTAKQTARNKAMRSSLRTQVKKANISIADSAETRDAEVKNACITLEKAASKGLIHRNKASRSVSRMMKRANRAEQAKNA